MRVLATLIMVALAGCSISEPPSRIVAKAEASGAGDLAGTSTLSMQAWLEKHRAVALDLDRMCAQVRNTAPARWGDTTEGRLCTAARGVASSTFQPMQSDHKAYRSGWK